MERDHAHYAPVSRQICVLGSDAEPLAIRLSDAATQLENASGSITDCYVVDAWEVAIIRAVTLAIGNPLLFRKCLVREFVV